MMKRHKFLFHAAKSDDGLNAAVLAATSKVTEERVAAAKQVLGLLATRLHHDMPLTSEAREYLSSALARIYEDEKPENAGRHLGLVRGRGRSESGVRAKAISTMCAMVAAGSTRDVAIQVVAQTYGRAYETVEKWWKADAPTVRDLREVGK
jgi:hypothetical protein